MNKNVNDGWQIPQKNTVLQHLPLNVAVELNLNLILKTNRMLTSLCTVWTLWKLSGLYQRFGPPFFIGLLLKNTYKKHTRPHVTWFKWDSIVPYWPEMTRFRPISTHFMVNNTPICNTKQNKLVTSVREPNVRIVSYLTHKTVQLNTSKYVRAKNRGGLSWK